MVRNLAAVVRLRIDIVSLFWLAHDYVSDNSTRARQPVATDDDLAYLPICDKRNVRGDWKQTQSLRSLSMRMEQPATGVCEIYRLEPRLSVRACTYTKKRRLYCGCGSFECCFAKILSILYEHSKIWSKQLELIHTYPLFRILLYFLNQEN